MRFLIILSPIAIVSSSSTLVNSVEASGGLSSFIRSNSGPEVAAAMDLAQMDLQTFYLLKNQIIPRARGNPPRSNVDLIRECTRFVTQEMDSRISALKASIWCVIAAKEGDNVKLNVSLSDEAFTKFVVPLAGRSLTQKRPAESQLPPAPSPSTVVRVSPEIHKSSPPIPVSEWRQTIPDFRSVFIAANREIVPQHEIFSQLFVRRREQPLNLPLGIPPATQSIAGKICDFVESIPSETRLGILDSLSALRHRLTLHDRVDSLMNPNDQLYGKYILSSLYIPESVARFLIKFVEGSHEGQEINIRSASQIAEYFLAIDSSYAYITPERIMEWFYVIRRCPNLGFERFVGAALPDDPVGLPRLNFSLECWKNFLIIPRRNRLAANGIETLWELPE